MAEEYLEIESAAVDGGTKGLSQLIVELTNKGFADLLKQPAIRGACLSTLEELGCRPPGSHLVLFCFEKLTRSVGGFLGAAACSRIAAMLLRNKHSGAFIGRIQALNAKAATEAELQSALLSDLSDENPPRDFKADAAMSWQVIAAAHTRDALNGLQSDLAELKDSLHDALIGALEEWDAFKPSWVETQPADPSAIAALRYSANVFQFLGRNDEEAHLDAFLMEVGPNDGLQTLRWVTLSGEGGLGKTRLAYEFVQTLPEGWVGGLLREADLRSLTSKARWRPKQPTLFVIDYPGRFPARVGEFLAYLQQSAAAFDLPVRVLLLERDGVGPWRDAMLDAGGASLMNLAWRSKDYENGWQLGPVDPAKLLASMQARFKGQGLTPPPERALLQMLFEVDGGLIETTEGLKPTRLPRPLFAAAIAEIGIRRLREGDDGATLFDGVDRDDVLGDIINRDRRTRWLAPLGAAAAPSPAALEAHENLLALATFCRNFQLAWLNDVAAPLAENYLPAHALSAPIPLDRALLARMTRIDADGILAPLEPDILGERHLLDRLDVLAEADVHTAMLDAGYSLAGVQAGYTAVLTRRDHPSRFATADHFYPGDDCSLAAAQIFAGAVVDHVSELGESRNWDEVNVLFHRLDHIRQDSRFAGDREIALAEAKAAVNVTNHAGEQQLWDRVSDALARIDRLRQDSRFAGDREIALREAMAAVNVTGRAGEHQLWDRVSDALARIDRLRQDSRFVDDGEILMQEGKAGLAVYRGIRKQDGPDVAPSVLRCLTMALSVLQAHQQGVAGAVAGLGPVFAAIKEAAQRWPENTDITAVTTQLAEAGINWDDVPDWPEDL